MAKKTNEQFIIEAKDKFPHIELLSQYNGSKAIMTFRCTKHDYIFEKTAYSFINSACGCNLCANENTVSSVKKSPSWFAEQLKDKNPYVEQLSQYVSMDKKIKVRCKLCGKDFESRAQDLLQGHFCRECAIAKFSQGRLQSHSWFIDNLKKYNPNYKNIDIMSQYEGRSKPIKCKCKKCSYEWETRASFLIDKRGGSGCPLCNQSKGEIIVYNYLVDNNISFEQQKEFPTLVGLSGFPLSYDFFVPSMKLLIEVNGLQHYSPINHFGGTRKFQKQQKHDRRKRLYANNHGYKLLEIECKENACLDKIVKILQNEFNNAGEN